MGNKTLDSAAVKRLYVVKGWTPQQIAEHFGVTRSGVAVRLKRDGVASRRPRKVVNIDIKRVKELYLKQKLSIAEIARSFGVAYTTVLNLLKKEGIPLRSNSRLRSDDIRNLYTDKGWTTTRIAEHFGVTRQHVSERLRRDGVAMRPRGAHVTQLDLEKVRKLYIGRGLGLIETAKTLKVGREALRRFLIRNGIERRAVGYTGNRKRVG